VDIRYHFVVDKVREVVIALQKIPTEKMQADFLTKLLSPSEFHKTIKGYKIMDTKTKMFPEEEC